MNLYGFTCTCSSEEGTEGTLILVIL